MAYSPLASRLACTTALMGCVSLAAPDPALAAEIVINTPGAVRQTLGDNDSLTISGSGSIVDDNAVLVNGSANAGSITNAGAILAGDRYGIYIGTSSTLTGGIINTGTIQVTSASASDGVYFAFQGSASGGLFNSGQIEATGTIFSNGVRFVGGTLDYLTNIGQIVGESNGIHFTGGSITNGITNSGTITGTNAAGIVARTNVTMGGISNDGIISGAQDGILLYSSAITNGITNSGNIEGTAQAGIDINNSSSLSGGIHNSGNITGGSLGIRLNSAASFSGGLTNSGLIQSSNISGTGVQIVGTTIDSLTNTRTGQILNGGGGISVTAGHITGALTNAGSINSNIGNGLYAGTGTTIGSITNSGIISSNLNDGIILLSQVSVGSLTNSGTIRGHTGIRLETSSSISGGIVNSGTIEGTGGTAILLGGLSSNVPITLNGGRIIGDIIDNNLSSGFSSLIIGGDFTTEGNFEVSNLTVGSGKTLTIASGNAVTLYDMPSSSGGTFRFGVNNSSGSGHGTLTVIGTPLDFTGAKLAVQYTGGPLTDGATLTLAQGNSSVVGGPGTTPTRLAGSTALWNFLAHESGRDLLLSVQRGTPTWSNGPNAAAGNALLSLDGTSNPQIQQVVNNLNAAPDDAALNRVAESVQPASDGAVFTAVQSFVSRTFDLADMRLASLQSPAQARTSSFTASDENWLGQNHPSRFISRDYRSLQGQSSDPLSLGIGNSQLGGTGNNAWVQVFGQSLQQGQRQGVAGYRADTGGMAFGYDNSDLIPHATIGAAVSYGSTGIRSHNANNARTDVDSYQATLYGGYDLGGGTWLRGMAAYAINDNETTRFNVGGTPGSTARGQFDGHQYAAQAEIGQDVAVGKAIITPSALVSYTYYDPEDYTEQGSGGTSLRVNQKSMQSLAVGIGVAARTDFKTPEGATITPEVRTGARYSPVLDRVETTSAFTGGGPAFSTQGPTLPKASANVGAGITYSATENWDVKVSYDYQVREDFQAHAGYVQTSFHF